VKLRTGWDRTRLLLHEHFPCRSEYLPVRRHSSPFPLASIAVEIIEREGESVWEWSCGNRPALHAVCASRRLP
jgi:hypothetical protein